MAAEHRIARRTLTVGMVLAVVALASGCLPGADLEPKSGASNNPGDGYHAGLLTNVRTGVHPEEDGFDRVVVDFLNFVPSWTVSYVDKPILADGSGEPIPIAGNHVLKVSLTGASQVFFTPASPQGYIDLYPGPNRIATNHPQVAEVVATDDFEAVMAVHLGTRAKVPFRVQVLDSPHRLVIDVAHG
jgi:hypothetical protein